MSAWWDQDHKLLLLTGDEFAALPDGTELTCIDDEIVVKGRDEIDDDTRGGCLAYGVTGNHPLRVAKLEAMAAAPKVELPPLPQHKVWTCKVGVLGDVDLPSGADAPMRDAVERAFFDLTGKVAQFNFSGWGGELERGEFHVVQPVSA